jgi:hypothetical protein
MDAFATSRRGMNGRERAAWEAGFLSALYCLRANERPPAFDRTPDVRRVQDQIAYVIRAIEDQKKADEPTEKPKGPFFIAQPIRLSPGRFWYGSHGWRLAALASIPRAGRVKVRKYNAQTRKWTKAAAINVSEIKAFDWSSMPENMIARAIEDLREQTSEIFADELRRLHERTKED